MTLRRLAAAAALALAAVAPARATPPFLGAVELDAPAALPPPPWAVAFALRGVRPEMLSELRARYGEVAFDGARARFTVSAYAADRTPPAPEDRAATFFIDHDEPTVAALRAEVVATAGKAPRARDLAAFVGAFIVDKDLSRRFDPASVVATRRQGDCSEHAVLLAALARMFGLPARVVTGYVVFALPDRPPVAAAHAWAEVFEDGAWRLADGTAPLEAEPVYLPIWTLRGDGPGLSLADPSRLSILHVAGLEVHPAAGSAAGR